MLADKPILIVADNIYLALDLTEAVELLSGRVVGPAATVAEALAILDNEQVAAAVIDAELTDSGVASLARALTEKCVPYVIQASRNIASEIAMIGPAARVLIKPIQPSDVVTVLATELLRSEFSEPGSVGHL